MGEHLLFSENMTSAPCDKAISDTFLGQAHIAGTGPDCTTCRECEHWFNTRKHEISGQRVRKSPEYYGKRHPDHPRELKKARCQRPIANKANRLVPHYAPSCRLFVSSDNPPPAQREVKSRA